jgi:DNA-directed RNA polymerase specialized sigma24 family protein
MSAAEAVDQAAPGTGQFTTTNWNVVLAAKAGGSEQADQALAKLCACYWYPLYSFIRRRGFNSQDAEDLTQEFFYRLLDRDYLSAVDYRKGRFRTFLLVALQRFMANEERYSLESPGGLSPEKIYERNCALALLKKTLDRLQQEFETQGKAARFQQLKCFLTPDAGPSSYPQLAVELKCTVSALKMAVSRMRARYGELLCQEVAQTVPGPEAVEDELNALLAALSY